MKRFLFGLLVALVCTACSDDDKLPPLARNYILMTTNSATTLNEFSKNTIDVEVMLAYTLHKDATISFALEGNDRNVLTLEESTLHFHAGDKVKHLTLRSNNKGILEEPCGISLRVADFSDPEMSVWGDPILITVEPGFLLPELTDRQKELLQVYKRKLGLDVARMLGKMDCRVKMTFPKDEAAVEDGDNIFSPSEVVEYPTETYITLSQYATEEQPVLKMAYNAMGLTSQIRRIFEKELSMTIAEAPYYPSVLEAVGFDKNNELFSMALDSILLHKDGTMEFVHEVVDRYGYTISGIPFQYDYSAWTRQRQLADDSVRINIVVKGSDGEIIETIPNYSMNQLIQEGVSLSPDLHLIHSPLDKDDWGEGMWMAPHAKADFKKGEFKFVFPWDHGHSTDYTKVEVTCTMAAEEE